MREFVLALAFGVMLALLFVVIVIGVETPRQESDAAMCCPGRAEQ